jgi:hypothetical protein
LRELAGAILKFVVMIWIRNNFSPVIDRRELFLSMEPAGRELSLSMEPADIGPF